MRGFTLIETLIAIVILTTAITGPLTIASRGLNAALVAKDRITAFYLAQDAMEYIRFARDSNRLAGGDWMTGAGGTGTVFDLTNCISTNGCMIDTTGQGTNGTVPGSCGTTCSVLKYNSTLKRFTYTSNAAAANSIFTRTILITPVADYDADTLYDEYKVTVTVTWIDQAGVTHQPVVIKENLMNWQ